MAETQANSPCTHSLKGHSNQSKKLKQKEIPTEHIIDLLEEKESNEVLAEEFVSRTEVLLAEDLVKTCDIFQDIYPKTLVECQYYLRKTEDQGASQEP